MNTKNGKWKENNKQTNTAHLTRKANEYNNGRN